MSDKPFPYEDINHLMTAPETRTGDNKCPYPGCDLPYMVRHHLHGTGPTAEKAAPAEKPAGEPFRSRITLERLKEIRSTHGAGPVRTIPGEGKYAFCCCCGSRTKQVREILGYNICAACDEVTAAKAAETLPEGLRDPLKVMERVRELQDRCRSGLGYQGEFLSETQCTLREGHDGSHAYASDPRPTPANGSPNAP